MSTSLPIQWVSEYGQSYLDDPAEPAFAELVAQHRMATRDQFERAAADVVSRYRT